MPRRRLQKGMSSAGSGNCRIHSDWRQPRDAASHRVDDLVDGVVHRLRALNVDVVAGIGVRDELRPKLRRQPGLRLQQLGLAGG